MKRKLGKFRIKVFILVFLVSFSSLTAFGLVVSNRMKNMAVEKVYTDAGKNALAIRNQVDQNMQIVEDLLAFLGQSGSLSEKNFTAFDHMAQELITAMPIINQIYIMDTGGMQIYKSSLIDSLGDRSDREYFQKAIQ